MKSKVDKIDIDKLVPVPVDLSKIRDVVKHDVVKKDAHNVKIKNIEDKISDITNLATNTTLNAKMNEVKKEIPILLTTTPTTPTPTTTHTATPTPTTTLNAKINEIKSKIANITNLRTTLRTTTALTAVENT